MPDSRLVTPDQLEDLAIEVLAAHHTEHLAKLERLRDLPARTLVRVKTIAHLASEDAQAAPSARIMPAVLVGVIGASTFTADETNALNAVVQLGVQVSVIGQHRRDTLRRRDMTAWTVAECLVQRMPRAGLVHAITLADYEPIASGDQANVLGDARLVFDIEVEHMLAVRGGLPPDDTDWPPGGPGGPPGDDPYAPPVGLPQARTVTYSLTKEPVVN